jgi:hypothetical protein
VDQVKRCLFLLLFACYISLHLTCLSSEIRTALRLDLQICCCAWKDVCPGCLMSMELVYQISSTVMDRPAVDLYFFSYTIVIQEYPVSYVNGFLQELSR